MTKENILMITVDCLRADYAYGMTGDQYIPTMKRLLKKALVFDQAVSTTSITTPNIADIMTGCLPPTHGIKSLNGYRLNSDIPTMAQLLKQNGYNTCAMITGPLLPQIGLGRGFDIYDYRPSDEDFGFGLEKRLADMFDKLTPPWFLALHVWIVHAPRRIPDKFNNNKCGKNKYERALSAFDYYLSEIISNLSMDRTNLIITGDHGENLKTGSPADKIRLLVGLIHKPSNSQLRNRIKSALVRIIRNTRTNLNLRKDGILTQPGHGFHVYEHLIRVPLIIASPQTQYQEQTLNHTARHVDILPTVLDLVNADIPPACSFDGQSLLPLVNDQRQNADPQAFIMASGEALIEERNWLYGIRDKQYKYLFSRQLSNYQELYDILADPVESKNIVKDHPHKADYYRRRTEEILSTQSVLPMDQQDQDYMAQTLKDLNYL